jgi:C4-dicarboxylate-specific signal transduction histidine kinase
MSENVDQELGNAGLKFFGTITASVTHEIKNCLSIINECSGLLDDLMASREGPDPAKLKRTTTRIAAQVERADQIVKRLNKFAHTVDEPVQHVDPRDMIDNLVKLSLRLAARKSVEIGAELGEQPLAITTNAYRLQHAVFSGIELALSVATGGETLTISLREENGGAIVSLDGLDFDSIEKTGLESSPIGALMMSLGGRVEIGSTDGGGRALALHFPRSMASE